MSDSPATMSIYTAVYHHEEHGETLTRRDTLRDSPHCHDDGEGGRLRAFPSHEVQSRFLYALRRARVNGETAASKSTECHEKAPKFQPFQRHLTQAVRTCQMQNSCTYIGPIMTSLMLVI